MSPRLPGGVETGDGASAFTGALLIIPAYNEATQLPSLLDQIGAQLPGLEVAVIDDGSDDDTAELARACGAVVIRHPFNLGYGAALQTGYKYALDRGVEYLVQMDADGQHLPCELPRLLELVRTGACDLALGSRFLEPTGYEMGLLRTLLRNVFGIIARLAGLALTDPTSGFQAMHRRVLELFVSDWYPVDFPDLDVLLFAHRRGVRILEHSVEMEPGRRESSLHSGLKPIYYCYKMALSLWATVGVRHDFHAGGAAGKSAAAPETPPGRADKPRD